MKIHYFQRYHAKENVATANTMLLLSRLYQYSSDKFFRFLKSEFFSDSFQPEIVFNLQEKSVDSIPDATITQESFKIVVETKMSDWFYSEQLMRHLNSFGDEKYKVMITLAPELMAEEKNKIFEQQLKEYNSAQSKPVIHINTCGVCCQPDSKISIQLEISIFDIKVNNERAVQFRKWAGQAVYV